MGMRTANPADYRVANPGYPGRHSRVNRWLGKASDQSCVDCDGQAKHWSQTHGTSGNEVAHYQPRCQSCHTFYDKSFHHKLADHEVLEIRELYKHRIYNQRQLAEIYGVHRPHITNIINRKHWKSL